MSYSQLWLSVKIYASWVSTDWITTSYVSQAVYSKLIQYNPDQRWCPERILRLVGGSNVKGSRDAF